jgi:hypothetical protein
VSDGVVIVGAGITGLACAAALGERTVVVDRIPVPGGVHGWERPETAALVDRCAGRLLLGSTAIRWDGERLLAVGPAGVERLAATVLVVASGARPRGRAELGIAGDRPAGVVPATVACHLAENGLPVGRRPLILGGGDWAARAAHELLAAGATDVRVLAPDGLLRSMPPGAAVSEGGTVAAVRGRRRVERVELSDGGELACDALVLAHGLVAARNVDGAVLHGTKVVYAQPLDDPASVAGAEAAGRACAEQVREMIGREV